MGLAADRVLVLVTSGLGPRLGGVGVVSSGLLQALLGFGRVSTWRHHHRWPRALRVPHLVVTAWFGALTVRPRFVLYEHVDLAVLSVRLAPLRGIPYGVFMHGTEVWRELVGDRRRALEGAALRMANSQSSLDRARKVNPWISHVEVTWLGARGPDGLRGVSRDPLALSIGRMEPGERYKGYDQVLEAWPLIRRRVPRAQLVLVGEGHDRPRLERKSKELGLEGVTFTGFVADDRKQELLSRASVLLFPSSGEGFGLVAIEAALAGVPVVALEGSVIAEVLPEGSVLIPGQAPAAIAAAAVPLLADPQRSSALGQEGRSWASEHLLEDHFVERARQAIARVLGG